MSCLSAMSCLSEATRARCREKRLETSLCAPSRTAQVAVPRKRRRQRSVQDDDRRSGVHVAAGARAVALRATGIQRPSPARQEFERGRPAGGRRGCCLRPRAASDRVQCVCVCVRVCVWPFTRWRARPFAARRRRWRSLPRGAPRRRRMRATPRAKAWSVPHRRRARGATPRARAWKARRAAAAVRARRAAAPVQGTAAAPRRTRRAAARARRAPAASAMPRRRARLTLATPTGRLRPSPPPSALATTTSPTRCWPSGRHKTSVTRRAADCGAIRRPYARTLWRWLRAVDGQAHPTRACGA
mmetsp:Transcript_17542/g.61675  ORF Transcript_17542/g.61675 Transcript_17542/m.61675 type:complete len:301 (-) Transcript_17542:74-976(-)